MTANRKPPRTTICPWALKLMVPWPFSKFGTLKTNGSAPAIVTGIEPIPPVKKVPPTSTDAMADNSHPMPSKGCPAPKPEARKTPASPRQRNLNCVWAEIRRNNRRKGRNGSGRQITPPSHDHETYAQRDRNEHRVVVQQTRETVGAVKVYMAHQPEQDPS